MWQCLRHGVQVERFENDGSPDLGLEAGRHNRAFADGNWIIEFSERPLLWKKTGSWKREISLFEAELDGRVGARKEKLISAGALRREFHSVHLSRGRRNGPCVKIKDENGHLRPTCVMGPIGFFYWRILFNFYIRLAHLHFPQIFPAKLLLLPKKFTLYISIFRRRTIFFVMRMCLWPISS